MDGAIEIIVDLSVKKDLVIEAVCLGMGLDKAYVLARCSAHDIEILTADAHFQDRIAYNYANYEKRLLELHSGAMVLAARKGNTTASQWKLAKLNASRWGDKLEDKSQTMPTIIFEADDNGLL